MKHTILLVLATACHVSASAADVLPPHLLGTWGTAASLYEGSTAQGQMHLAADGLGLLIGSTPPMVRADGADDGKPAPRAIIGVPLRATLEGDTLTVQGFMPPAAANASAATKAAAQQTAPPFHCHYDAAGPTLDCRDQKHPLFLLKRYADSMAAEVASQLAAIRQALNK